MVSMQRRLNSTGRRRIPKDRINVTFERALDAAAPPCARARLDLSGLDLPGDARVSLEAYFRSSAMRFSCGMVAALDMPARMDLTEIDRGGAIQFRLLVIAADGSGRILAAADGIRPAGQDGADRQALLPVTETDLREEIWKVDVDERVGPRLLLNSRIPGLAAKLRSEPLYQGLILPHALRIVLRNLPPEGQDDDDGAWGEDWRKFLKALGVPDEPASPDDDARDEWIEDAIENFSELKKFAEHLRGRDAAAGGDE